MLPFKKVLSWKKTLNKDDRIFSENIQKLPQDIIDLLDSLHVK
jgi:hypothetical protein